VDLAAVFDELKKVMKPYESNLDCTINDTENYSLDTRHVMKNKKPLFFGAVQIKKNYVSYHLMPVYVEPALLDAIPDKLKQRMHGKSCFNFKTIDSDLLREIEKVTAAGYKSYEDKGYI